MSDLIDAMLLIRERATGKAETFNIGPTDDGMFVRQIAGETVAAVASGAEIHYGSGAKGWVGDVPRFMYSTAKVAALGWRPKLNSLEEVRRAIGEIAAREGLG